MLSRRFLLGLIIFLSFFSVNKLPINPVYPLGIFTILLSLRLIKINHISTYTIIGSLFLSAFMIAMCIGINFQIENEIPAQYISTLLFGYSLILGLLSYEIGRKTRAC